jgi:hypothetical protein
MPRSPLPAAGETLRHLRAFPGPRLSPARTSPPHTEERPVATVGVTAQRRKWSRPPGPAGNCRQLRADHLGAGATPARHRMAHTVLARSGPVSEATQLCKLATPLSMHSREEQATLPGRSCVRGGQVPVRYASRSIFAAMMKSLRDKPLTVWVQRAMRTFPQVTVSSG